jgi:ketosteroid isomerase-like protein
MPPQPVSFTRQTMKPRDFGAMTGPPEEAAKHYDHSAQTGPQEQRHLRSVHAQVDAISRGDIASLLKDAHDDVQLDVFAPPEFNWIRHAKGLDELRRAVELNLGSVEDQRPEISNVIAQGDSVVLIGRERGTIRASAEAYDVQFVEKFTFREGRLAAIRIVAAKTT